MSARTYVKSGSTVTVEPADGRVIVVTRIGFRAPSVVRCPADAPADLARELGEDLLADGYDLTA